MPVSIGHTAHYPYPPETMRATFVDGQYWRDRLELIGGPTAQLIDVAPEGNRMRVAIVQSVAAADLPGEITKVRKGDMIINCTQLWGPDSATVDAAVEGTPARLIAGVVLAGDGTGCTARFDGEIQVSVPILGSRLERTIAAHLVGQFPVEDDFTLEWLSSRS